MTEEEFQKELDSIKARLDELGKPKGSLNELTLRLQHQLKALSLQMKAHRVALQKLLPEYKHHYEESYSELQRQAAQNGEADFDSW